jgi:predicted Zn-dependent protease
VLGATLAPRWDERRGSRLRLVHANRDDTLNDIATRSGSDWSAAKIGVANAIEAKAKLSGGEAIKVRKREPCRP